MHQFRYQIYTDGGDELAEWQGPGYDELTAATSLTQALQQPFKIATVPAMFNVPRFTNAYNTEYLNYDWSKFDLVLLRETIWESFESIVQNCVEPMGIKKFLVLSQDVNSTDPRNIYRPFWFFRMITENKFQNTESHYKKFLFDALLGTPRMHRTFVMASFQKNPELLKASVVTYRDDFNFYNGLDIDHNIESMLGITSVTYPYISENLNPDWEHPEVYSRKYKYFLDGIDIPWKIYQNTWYSICTESADNHGQFPEHDYVRITEKTARVLLAKRVFVMFGAVGTLKFLQSLGFRTFSDIIDESYDLITDPYQRFSLAFEQVKRLADLDPVDVYKITQERREHNYYRLYEYHAETKNSINKRFLDSVPQQYLTP